MRKILAIVGAVFRYVAMLSKIFLIGDFKTRNGRKKPKSSSKIPIN